MIAKMFMSILLLSGLAYLVVRALRRRFTVHLDSLEAELRKPGAVQRARSGLPAEVEALASRLGAAADGTSSFASFEQSGQMWQLPGRKPMDFMARQTVRLDAPAFLWRAATGPPLSVVVADYFVAGTGGLEVMLLGAFPLARIVGGASVNQGEALRYLAELPWNPDAIFANKALDWTVVGAKTIKVATGTGSERGEVTFDLDDNGLICRASAPSRAYTEKDGRVTMHPWHGRFWNYQRIGDRYIPVQGEVSWSLDAGDFVYWQGRILSWNGSSTLMPATEYALHTTQNRAKTAAS